MEEKTQISFVYQFHLDENDTVTFEINLDSQTLEYIPSNETGYPSWAKLDYSPCDNCKHLNDGIEYCPVAANISVVVDKFNHVFSYGKADISVETENRTYSKNNISIQRGISSIMGLIMAASKCRDLERLRPMVKYHLPFASIDETVYRVTSMYLLAQFLILEKEGKPDWKMKKLVKFYNRINHINRRICNRIQTASQTDSSLNAVVILDAFASMVPLTVKDNFSQFYELFTPYFKD